MEMLPSHRLMQRKATLTKLPSLQALLKDYQTGASTSKKIGKPSLQALLNFRRFLLPLCAPPRGMSCADVSRRISTSSTSSKIGKLNLRVKSSSTSIASKILRTTPSSLMEMMQSSFALRTMTFWMANSPMLLADFQASHMNGW